MKAEALFGLLGLLAAVIIGFVSIGVMVWISDKKVSVGGCFHGFGKPIRACGHRLLILLKVCRNSDPTDEGIVSHTFFHQYSSSHPISRFLLMRVQVLSSGPQEDLS